MQTDFPENKSNYLNAKSFQDQKVKLNLLGWEKKPNVDRPDAKKPTKWKDTVKYCLRYSYPQMAVDEFGVQRLDRAGQPFENSNYDPRYPQGYSIIYHFQEGDLESGSLPLWKAFCSVKAKAGDTVIISKTGTDKSTVWFVKKLTADGSFGQRSDEEVPEIDTDLQPDDNVPF